MPATITMTAEKLKEDVENILNDDNRIDTDCITVEVENGTARLNGKVPDYSDRRIAEADAAIVPGISNVDNRLIVERHAEAELPSDREIRAAVQRSLRWNSTVDDTGIGVSVNNGIVRLDGTVASSWQKFRAQELAENITGVAEVDNHLAITPLEHYEDDLIREEVITELSRNLRETGTAVGVTVDNGVVILDGTVPDLSSYRAAESIAFYVRGVINVSNQLIIQPVTEPQQ